MPENSEPLHRKLSFHQLVNLSLAAFLFLGVAITSYTVYNLRSSDADAARGGGTTTGSISINQVEPHLGDYITFTTSGGRRIALACYQGGLNMVYSADQAVGTSFLLGGTSSKWLTSGGDVLCYAWLYDRNLSKGFIASTSFTAFGAR